MVEYDTDPKHHITHLHLALRSMSVPVCEIISDAWHCTTILSRTQHQVPGSTSFPSQSTWKPYGMGQGQDARQHSFSCVRWFIFKINLELFSRQNNFVPPFFLYINVQIYWIFSCKNKPKKKNHTTIPLFKLLNCHLPGCSN